MDRCPLWTFVALLSLACLEPNPHFVSDGGSESGTDGSTAETSADTTTDTDSGCDACELAFEVVEFDADADGASGTVPTPDLPHTVALAVIDEYAPGSADSLGYALEWTNDGSAWRFDVTLSDAANNSHVRGRAIVLGFAEPPSEAELQLRGTDDCDSANLDTSLVIVDAVERYDPDGDDELSYARSSPGADAIEYCITNASSAGAEIGVKLIGFAPPAGVTAEQVDEVVLASAAPQSSDYPQIDGAAILHLLSARSFDEGAATNLGYAIDCNDSAAPWACSFDLLGFRDGVEAVVGGAIVAIP